MADIVQKLVDAYTDETWMPFLDVIEAHDKNSCTSVEDVLSKLDSDEWDRQDVITCMKECDELGLGRFYKGAKGKKSRIQWYVAPSAIAKAARGDGQDLKELFTTKYAHRQSSDTNEYRGKEAWNFSEVLGTLAQLTSLPASHLRVAMTIPEARKVLADSQGISEDDVMIRLG